MGELNAVPMRINGVEGAAGQAKLSGGPDVLETWGNVVDGPAAIAAIEAAGLDLASGARINITSILTANDTWSGLSATFTAGEVLALGDLIYILAADSEAYKSDADALASMPAIAMATGPTTNGNPFEFLLVGFMRHDAWGWTPGSLLYASVTGGEMSHTAPVGSGDQVQAVGIAITAAIVYFHPDLTLVELT